MRGRPSVDDAVMTDALGWITALATLALAAATTWMACKTAASVRQTQQHHADNMMPLCIFDPPRDPKIGHGDGTSNGAPLASISYRFLGAVRNSGLGPALNLRAVMRVPGLDDHEATRKLPALGRGEAWEERGTDASDRGIFFEVPLQSGSDVRMSGSGWELYLEYTDVFGTPYHTKHVHDPQQPWTQFAKGHRPRTKTAAGFA